MSECDVCGDPGATYRSTLESEVCIDCERFWYETGRLPGEPDAAAASGGDSD